MHKFKTKAGNSVLTTFMKLKLFRKSQANLVPLALCGVDSQHEF